MVCLFIVCLLFEDDDICFGPAGNYAVVTSFSREIVFAERFRISLKNTAYLFIKEKIS